MYAVTLATALFAASVPLSQAFSNGPLKYDLMKRQGGDSFIPGSTPVTSCPSDTTQCGTRWCYRPQEGDLCCKEGYACPAGSFCLTQGYCCPEGEDPETCARENGVTLPSGFNTAPAGNNPPASSAPVYASSSSPPPVSLPSPISVSTPPPYPLPSSSAVYNPTGTAPGTISGTISVPQVSVSTTQFQGGAKHQEIGGALAVAVGLLGYLI